MREKSKALKERVEKAREAKTQRELALQKDLSASTDKLLNARQKHNEYYGDIAKELAIRRNASMTKASRNFRREEDAKSRAIEDSIAGKGDKVA